MSDRSQRRRERPRERARDRQRGHAARRTIWQGPAPIVGVVLLVAAAVVIFILTSRAPAAPGPAAGEQSAVAAKATSIPPSVFDAVAGGGVAPSLKVAKGADLLAGSSGKPVIVYVGGEFCPYCASQRWSIVVALSRFGTWSGLTLSRSSSTDVFPNTPTFTFRGASYTSDVIELSAVETADREGKRLDTPNAQQQRSMDRFDPQGSIPYLSIADRYYVSGSGYPPDVLAGKSWDQVASALSDPTSPVTRAIVGNADQITAAICAVTAQKPAAVCTSPSVRGLLPAQ